MKHHKNSRDAASPAPPSQRQNRVAAFVPAPWQQAPFSTRRNSASILPVAFQSSQSYVILRTSAVTIAQFLINVQNIRNQRKCLKTIVSTHF